MIDQVRTFLSNKLPYTLVLITLSCDFLLYNIHLSIFLQFEAKDEQKFNVDKESLLHENR